MTDYYTWHQHEIPIGDEVVLCADKAGLPDTMLSARLLAESIDARPGERAIDLNCGSGLVGTILLKRGVDVSLFDDNIVAVEAAKRTLSWNGFSAEKVHIGEPGGGGYDLVVLTVPKGRAVGRRSIGLAAQLLKPGGRLYLAGANRAGVKSLINDADEIIGPTSLLRIKSSHRVAVSQRLDQSYVPETIAYTEHAAVARGRMWHYVAQPGVFAWEQLDEGTAILIEAMQLDPEDIVLDLGCGYGVVGLVAATLTQHVISVDASAAAVEAARRTYDHNHVPNAEVRLSDCASAVFDTRFDAVVTNPPFHQGVGTDYAVARQFVLDAERVLKPGGHLWLVANRFLRYEREMEGYFSKVRVAYEDNRYRVLAAQK